MKFRQNSKKIKKNEIDISLSQKFFISHRLINSLSLDKKEINKR